MEWKHSPGLVDYEEALRWMEARASAIAAEDAPEAVWLLEHPPLYTAGSSAKPSDLLETGRFPVYDTGRGGQYTYHGPGQRVAYVLLNLRQRAQTAGKAPDLRQFVRLLEGWLIATLAQLGVEGFRRDGRVGIWVQTPGGEAKIAALGIRMRQWVSTHGIALNVSPDLSHYSGIIPCGISAYGVTSLHALGVNVSLAEVDRALEQEFVHIFGA